MIQYLKKRKAQQAESGAAIVEGALVFGLFIFLLLAMIEFGLYFMSWSSGRNATTEGAHKASISGRASEADYTAVRAMRQELKTIRGQLKYVIIFKAESVSDVVPPQCVAEAEAKQTDLLPVDKAHGVFLEASGVNDPDKFDWNSKTLRPTVACNIYYPNQIFDLPIGAFIYTRPKLSSDPASTALDRFWPGQYRIDRMTGPVDFLGIYVSTKYTSATGLLGTRPIDHSATIQIESRSVN
jgi:TadE-like protein